MTDSLKSLFEYDNYREFLKDSIAYKKRINRGFSMRNFARLAGFQAHSFVVRVLQGTKDLSLERIDDVARVLKLNREETSFFRSLVLFNQAKSAEERSEYATEILSHRTYKKIHPLDTVQFKFLGTWYFVVIRELVALPDFVEDYEWIAKQVNPAIQASQAKKAIENLIEMGLLTRESDGRLRQTNSLITTANNVTTSALATYHRDMLRLASESIDRIPRESRELAAQTLGVSQKTALKIIEMMRDLRVKTMELVSQDESPEVIYQLNFQLFPLSVQPLREKK